MNHGLEAAAPRGRIAGLFAKVARVRSCLFGSSAADNGAGPFKWPAVAETLRPVATSDIRQTIEGTSASPCVDDVSA